MVEITPEGTHFSLWAPLAQKAEAVILNGNGTVLRVIELAAGKGGGFSGLDSAGKAGDRYQYRLDGRARIADPASRLQPEGVHGPSVVVDPSSYRWQDKGWTRPPFRDLVIYELHIGTFTPEGTFAGATRKLAHLRSLGINAVELMPVAEFAGERNWGYDGVLMFAPAHVYGHPDDLRALVDAAHQEGIAVILDVVYNHFGPDGNNLALCIGGYLDETAKTPWGGAICYGHPGYEPLRHMVRSNVEYWMEEFHIDGFRLDATHAIVDSSPLHLLKEITSAIHQRHGYAIAEDCRNDVALMLPVEKGGYGFDAVWADDFHHIVRVAHTREQKGYFGEFKGTIEELMTTLEHGWLYMGQISPVTNRKRGTFCQQAPAQAFIHCISNHDQTGNHPFGKRMGHMLSEDAGRAAAALLCLSPGTPMLFMGQEWDASTPFLFFVDHNEELNGRIAKGRLEEFRDFVSTSDPAIPAAHDRASFTASKLRWDELAETRHAATLALYRTCLQLRREHTALRPAKRESWRARTAGNGVGLLFLTSEDLDWIIVFNLAGEHSGGVQTEFGSDVSGRNWQLVLSTAETRFGGNGNSGFDLARMHAHFALPETVVLVSQKPKKELSA